VPYHTPFGPLISVVLGEAVRRLVGFLLAFALPLLVWPQAQPKPLYLPNPINSSTHDRCGLHVLQIVTAMRMVFVSTDLKRIRTPPFCREQRLSAGMVRAALANTIRDVFASSRGGKVDKRLGWALGEGYIAINTF
jgi:hypothetical protein